jgi:hypothetical protein
MSSILSRGRAWLIAGATAAGIAIGAAGIAGAATSSTTNGSSSSASSNSAAATAPAPSQQNPATISHGPGETLLTGTTADKVKAAALAAEPGATIIRVETDSSGTAPYEAHMQKSDGSDVTVYVDSSFKVVSTASGFGGGPAGQQAPQGAPSA